jgi:hypothetical protein
MAQIYLQIAENGKATVTAAAVGAAAAAAAADRIYAVFLPPLLPTVAGPVLKSSVP